MFDSEFKVFSQFQKFFIIHPLCSSVYFSFQCIYALVYVVSCSCDVRMLCYIVRSGLKFENNKNIIM